MRGVVVWVRLGGPQGTHETAGTRPGVIVQAAATFDKTSVTLVVPGTSKAGAARFPHVVQVHPSAGNGLTTVTWFMCYQLAAVDKRFLSSAPLGQLSGDDMQRIDTALRAALGL